MAKQNMTSIPTISKISAGKRTAQQGPGMSSSPTCQKSIEDMFQRERSNSFKDLQVLLQNMHEAMTKNHEEMKKEIGQIRNDTGELKGKMQAIDDKFEGIQEQLIKNEQRLQDMEVRMEKEEKKVEDLSETLLQANKELETTVIFLEAEKAAHYLRFQNVQEKRGEDLPDMMAEFMAKALGIGKEEMLAEIDEIYRVHTNYARRHNLPKEIHVRLVKKSIRDELLHRSREEPLELQGQQITILKQIPRRMRDLRRGYQFLTSKLISHNVNFRWLTPEGILVTWQDRRYRLDSIEKAEDFYKLHFNNQEDVEVDDQDGREVRERGTRRIALEGKILAEDRGNKSGVATETYGTRDKDARVPRTTRTTKPRYK